MRLAGVAITALRRVDATTPIVLLSQEQVDPDIANMLQIDAAVHIVTLPSALAAVADKAFSGRRCGAIASCWMKFLVWALTAYKSVMFVDVDVLAVKPLTGAFELFEQRRAPTPYDIAGVPDVIAALRFPLSDCFNTGLFIVAPDMAVFEEFWAYAAAASTVHAVTGDWPGADTWPLVTWPASRGAQWVRLPLTYNVYPHVFLTLLEAYTHIDGPLTGFGSVHALHFVYPSKALFSRQDCKNAAAELRGACQICCEAFHHAGREMHNKTAAAALRLGLEPRPD